jgi:hypothetical protein
LAEEAGDDPDAKVGTASSTTAPAAMVAGIASRGFQWMDGRWTFMVLLLLVADLDPVA